MMAWLHAVPKPPAGTRRADNARPDTRSRIERMSKVAAARSLPPNPMPHITARLVEMGLKDPAGTALSWLTIDAWQRCTRVDLSPWEARLIRRLSLAYVGEGRKAESENCPPPWRAEVSRREADDELAKLRMVLG